MAARRRSHIPLVLTATSAKPSSKVPLEGTTGAVSRMGIQLGESNQQRAADGQHSLIEASKSLDKLDHLWVIR